PDRAAGTLLQAVQQLVQARLDRAASGLDLLRRQAASGADVGQVIALVEKEIELLRQQFDAAARAAGPGPGPRAHKALLVEDDGNQRELLAGLLRLSGFAV